MKLISLRIPRSNQIRVFCWRDIYVQRDIETKRHKDRERGRGTETDRHKKRESQRDTIRHPLAQLIYRETFHINIEH